MVKDRHDDYDEKDNSDDEVDKDVDDRDEALGAAKSLIRL